jgi:hypothetical protein
MNKETLNRMIEEAKALQEKIIKIQTFLKENKDNEEISPINKDLLVAQLQAMATYNSILSIRIAVNNSNED